jgi:hypothetical protein
MQGRAIFLLLALALGVSSCAYYDDLAHASPGPRYGGYDYVGEAYDGAGWEEKRMRLAGPGADLLDPWLALTSEGRDIVALGFRAGGEGHVSEEMAERANIWFRRYADHDRDMRLTDEEIRTALAHAASERGTR